MPGETFSSVCTWPCRRKGFARQLRCTVHPAISGKNSKDSGEATFHVESAPKSVLDSLDSVRDSQSEMLSFQTETCSTWILRKFANRRDQQNHCTSAPPGVLHLVCTLLTSKMSERCASKTVTKMRWRMKSGKRTCPLCDTDAIQLSGFAALCGCALENWRGYTLDFV